MSIDVDPMSELYKAYCEICAEAERMEPLENDDRRRVSLSHLEDTVRVMAAAYNLIAKGLREGKLDTNRAARLIDESSLLMAGAAELLSGLTRKKEG
jgi:hypothetical protein